METTAPTETTADSLTDEMIWQVVKAAADERNAVLLGYCTLALRQKTGGGLRHAREVLCKVINAAIGALNASATIGALNASAKAGKP